MKRLTNKQVVLVGLITLLAVAAGAWQADTSADNELSAPVVKQKPVVKPESVVKPEPVVKPDAKVNGSVSRPASRHATTVMEVADVQLQRLDQRTDSDVEMIDVFKGKSWYVPPPPPPPPKPVPPPPPTAPPLPYAFIGSYQEPGGRLIIFLNRGERVYSVSPGDVIENTYHVDGVAAGKLSLTYLPLNIKQTMNIGDLS